MSKVIRYIWSIMFVWLMILIYMGLNLYQLVEDSQKSSQELQRVVGEVDFLKRENSKLRKESFERNLNALQTEVKRTTREEETPPAEYKKRIRSFKNRIIELEGLVNRMKDGKGLDNGQELIRRKVESNVKEMWYLVSGEVNKIKRVIGNKVPTQRLDRLVDFFGNLQMVTVNDLEMLRNSNGMGELRKQSEQDLSMMVQARIHKLQNPDDCQYGKKLICSLNKGCGYGCQMHHVLYCFILAYSTKRTMIIDSQGWRYSGKGWEGVFKPVSQTCKEVPIQNVEWGGNLDSNAQVIHLPIVDSLFPRPRQMPLSIPMEFSVQLEKFHGSPFLWWIGQFAKYLFRFQPSMLQEVRSKKDRLGFLSPIVGVQVRRTDKINLEAAFHGIDEYMYWVDLYFKRIELQKGPVKRRVFLASDDDSVLPEAKRKYPNYEFLSDNRVSKLAGLEHRYSEDSLHGVITDIELLSDTDYLVCTFSSQVCRLAYEIMNNKHPDASERYHSLDDIYYFGGQNEHKVRAIMDHVPTDTDQLELKKGDEIAIAGNHWDGYSKGQSHRTRREGTFPSYKVEDVIEKVEFPKYDV